MTHLLDLMREDVRHTLNRLTDLHAQLKETKQGPREVELKTEIFREQQELLAFRREMADERRYRDEREDDRDPFPRHPYASEFYPVGKL